MARSVADAGLLLSAMVGADLRDPLSLTDASSVFAGALDKPLTQPRVAWSADLGFLPVAQSVRDTFALARADFEQIGCRVEDAAPGLEDAPAVFQTLRAHGFAGRYADYYENHRDQLKDTVQWNTAKGLSQMGSEVAHAEIQHTAIYRRMLSFFDSYDFLVLPTTQVLPFSKELDWVREIEGVRFDDYLQWMEICSVISLTGTPVLSIPCGFTPDGLPVGLQIVGPPGDDLSVLQLAHAFEQVSRHAEREPDYRPIVGG